MKPVSQHIRPARLISVRFPLLFAVCTPHNRMKEPAMKRNSTSLQALFCFISESIGKVIQKKISKPLTVPLTETDHR